MKEKILLIIGSSSIVSGAASVITNTKHNKNMNIIGFVLMLIGSLLSASALDNMLKPEECYEEE